MLHTLRGLVTGMKRAMAGDDYIFNNYQISHQLTMPRMQCWFDGELMVVARSWKEC